jgi:hypothetical protein
MIRPKKKAGSVSCGRRRAIRASYAALAKGSGQSIKRTLKMRHPGFVMLCLGGAVVLSACENNSDAQVERALKDVNVIDESNLNDVMLSVADPNEAVAYFTKTLQAEPRPYRPDARSGQIADPGAEADRGRPGLAPGYPRRRHQ